MARRKLPIIRWKPKPEKPKPAYDPTLGSGWTPGQDGGSWLLPDWTKEPFKGLTRGRD